MAQDPEKNDLEKLRDAIEVAWDEARKFGLDPFPTHFELVPATIMYEFASYSIPGRFSHWTFGKAYYRQKMQYDFGLSKIYEMVVNTNPSYAFLMEMNSLLENTFVAAHVFGHTDFFKNNAYFQHTSRRMIDKASVHADRIAKYEFEHGREEVERFLDAALAIQEHVDYNLLLRDQHEEHDKDKKNKDSQNKPTSDYEDLWGMDQEEKAKRAQEEREKLSRKPPKFPKDPEKDLLLFLSRHAPHLQPWQRDIIEIVRTEMLYFVPQMQTKVMNEGWACLIGNSLVLTKKGFLSYEKLHDLLAKNKQIMVGSGGGKCDQIVDRHIRRNAPTIRLRTRRGLILEGAKEHKLSIGPDKWIALKNVKVGQRIPLSVGDNIWPEEYVPVTAKPRVEDSRCNKLHDSLESGGSGTLAMNRDHSSFAYETVEAAQRQMGPELSPHTQSGEQLVRTAASARPERGSGGELLQLGSEIIPLMAPMYVTEEFGEFLGYLVGDGNIHTSKNAIDFTTGDREQADRYAQLVLKLFSIETEPFWDDQTANEKGGRWCVAFYAANILDLLKTLGIDLSAKAQEKCIPDVILCSPKSVMSAFLRAYFDCDGCASASDGVILSTFSDEIAKTLQIVLLNYGILSHRYGTNIRIKGISAQLFAKEINFGLVRKQELLQQYLTSHRWFRKVDTSDEVVSIKHSVADVYDITVDRSHRYVANGMLHHNSIWHSRIMRKLAEEGVITDSQFVEFAALHSSVLVPSRTSINPYYLGYRIFEDIEKRWNKPTDEEQKELGRKPEMGLQKMFDVRALENDVSFLRNYLTKDLIKDLDLYVFKKDGDDWVISEKNWEKVRDTIVSNMTNFGYPYLVVENGDYRGNRELYIRHLYEGQELDLPYAEKTLQHVYTLWGRPVHLETLYENKRILLTYDGERNSKSSLEK